MNLSLRSTNKAYLTFQCSILFLDDKLGHGGDGDPGRRYRVRADRRESFPERSRPHPRAVQTRSEYQSNSHHDVLWCSGVGEIPENMQLASDVHYSIDLTAATRAYMLEPQWNPTVEEQAMARIHRIGQTRPVTTIRYIMEDSIEEVKAISSLYSYSRS
jgi:hypothetical protein